MNRTRLALYTIVLAATWFCLGRYWPSPQPEPARASGRFDAITGAWPAHPAELEAFFRSVPRGEQDKALMALLASGRATAGSAVYNYFIFERYRSIWKEHRKGEPAVLLEIGPGYNLGQGFLFVLAGAGKYIGLDLFMSTSAHDLTTYQAAHDLLQLAAPGSVRVKPEAVYSVKGRQVVFDPKRIEYLYPRESYDLGVPDGSIDYLYSNSVFEHVSDPDRTAVAIAKALSRGGLSANHVDFRDHEDFSKPLEFLKADEASWRARFTGDKRPDYTNRKRLPDILAAFENAGLRIVRVDSKRIPVSEEMRGAMHPDFRKFSLEDLGVTGAMIVVQKP